MSDLSFFFIFSNVINQNKILIQQALFEVNFIFAIMDDYKGGRLKN